MFSYDQEKAIPGTQVIFDTNKNSFTPSTFKVPPPVGGAGVKNSGLKDIKPANAMISSVNEVVV